MRLKCVDLTQTLTPRSWPLANLKRPDRDQDAGFVPIALTALVLLTLEGKRTRKCRSELRLSVMRIRTNLADFSGTGYGGGVGGGGGRGRGGEVGGEWAKS